MLENIFRNAVRFVSLVLLQALILNHVELGGYINPFLYVMFVLLLPVEIPGWLLLLLSFFLGLSIDMFSDTPGMHTAATVFMAFCRPYLLKIIAPRDGYESDKLPVVRNLGLSWFLTYTSILVLLHHLVLFYLEVFRFSEFFSTLLRVLASSLLSITLIVLTQYLFYYKSKDIKN